MTSTTSIPYLLGVLGLVSAGEQEGHIVVTMFASRMKHEDPLNRDGRMMTALHIYIYRTSALAIYYLL